MQISRSLQICSYPSASSRGTVLSCSKSILLPAMTRTMSGPNIFFNSFTQFFTWKCLKQLVKSSLLWWLIGRPTKLALDKLLIYNYLLNQWSTLAQAFIILRNFTVAQTTIIYNTWRIANYDYLYKGVFISDVIDKYSAVWVPVVDGSKGMKFFLAGCVPDGQVYTLPTNV